MFAISSHSGRAATAWGRRAGLLATAGLSACVQAWAAPVAELKVHAEAAGDVLLVGDVADLRDVPPDEARRVASRFVAQSPRAGVVARVNRAQLRAALPAGWRISGAATVEVVRATQEFGVDRLCATAVAAARARLDALPAAVERSVDCVLEPGESLRVPAGAQLLAADVSRLELVDGPQRVDLDVGTLRHADRAVGVTLRLGLRAPQWCARGPIAAGESLAASAFERCVVPVRHRAQIETAGAALPGGRLRRALHAGDVLAATDVAGVDAALAGDSIVVRYRAGGFQLESRGTLLADARLGDQVRVRIGAANQAAVGRLAGEGLVELEDQP